MIYLIALYTALSLYWPHHTVAMPYREQTLLGICFFSLVSVVGVFRRSAFLGIAALYFVIVCYLQTTNPHLYMPHLEEINKARLQFFAIESWFVIILAINLFLFGVKERVDYSGLLANLFLFGVTVLVIETFFGWLQSVWFFNPGGAQDVGFLGSLYPFYWIYYRNKSLPILAIGSLFYVGALIGCGSAVGFAIGLLNLAFIVCGQRAFIFGLFAPGAYWFLREFFNDNGRLNIWQNFYASWVSWGDTLLGTGAGSFQFLNIKRQMLVGEKSLFLWAHNSWLQTMFEYGYVGLLLMVFLFGVLAYRLRFLIAEFWCLWALALYAMVDMPLNHMTSLALIVYLFIRGYDARASIKEETDCFNKRFRHY